jgi:hypothetical protein
MQLVCIVIPNVVLVIPKPPHRCNASIEHLQQYFRKTLFMLVVIRSELRDDYQTRPKVSCQS